MERMIEVLLLQELPSEQSSGKPGEEALEQAGHSNASLILECDHASTVSLLLCF